MCHVRNNMTLVHIGSFLSRLVHILIRWRRDRWRVRKWSFSLYFCVFCISLVHFVFVFVKLVLLSLAFFSTKLGRTSAKRPILCRVGVKLYSIDLNTLYAACRFFERAPRLVTAATESSFARSQIEWCRCKKRIFVPQTESPKVFESRFQFQHCKLHTWRSVAVPDKQDVVTWRSLMLRHMHMLATYTSRRDYWVRVVTTGGSVAEWLASGAEGPGSNRSRDAVGLQS